MLTSVHLAVLPEATPVMAQSATPVCSAGTTSPKGRVTVEPPTAVTKSASERPKTRTFLPLRSAMPLIGVRQKNTCAVNGTIASSLMPCFSRNTRSITGL